MTTRYTISSLRPALGSSSDANEDHDDAINPYGSATPTHATIEELYKVVIF
jgi:hypothetical protein